MPQNQLKNYKSKHTCSTGVAIDEFLCRYCNGSCKKYGFNKAGKQRFKCRLCTRTSLVCYDLFRLTSDLDIKIIILLKEGCGTRSMGRILKVSVSTISRRIKKIGSNMEPPVIGLGQVFEVDELHTFIGNKSTPVWIAYAMNKITKQVATFNIGSRSNQMLSQVTEPLLKALPSRIYTDKLLQYKTLIPPTIHCTKKYSINHIERKNLALRTHLKRLNRRTICFSRSLVMLRACLMIYFFC